MRYIINTEDSEGIIGIQLSKWMKEGKLTIIEKADPVLEIKEKLEKASRALEILKKAGYNSEVMEIFLMKKTGLGQGKIHAMLKSQEEFFKAVGIK